MVPTVVFSVTVSGTAEDLDLYSFRTSLLAFLHEDEQLANVELSDLIVEVRAGSIVLDTTIVLDEAEVQTTQDNVGAMLLNGQASSTLAVDVIAYTMPEVSTEDQSQIVAARNSLVDLEDQALSTSENNNAATVALVVVASIAAVLAVAVVFLLWRRSRKNDGANKFKFRARVGGTSAMAGTAAGDTHEGQQIEIGRSSGERGSARVDPHALPRPGDKARSMPHASSAGNLPSYDDMLELNQRPITGRGRSEGSLPTGGLAFSSSGKLLRSSAVLEGEQGVVEGSNTRRSAFELHEELDDHEARHGSKEKPPSMRRKPSSEEMRACLGVLVASAGAEAKDAAVAKQQSAHDAEFSPAQLLDVEASVSTEKDTSEEATVSMSVTRSVVQSPRKNAIRV